MVSIENTIEYSAWFDNLSYEKYKEACKQVSVTPLWGGTYSLLCTAFGKQRAFNNIIGEENNG